MEKIILCTAGHKSKTTPKPSFGITRILVENFKTDQINSRRFYSKSFSPEMISD